MPDSRRRNNNGQRLHLGQMPSSPYTSSFSSTIVYPTSNSPVARSPTFTRNPVLQKPISPAASINSDFDHVALERLVADVSGGLPDVQHYPLRARRPDHDPLQAGIAAVGHDLGDTLLPLLQIPMPKGPDNIGNPHCRGVKGIGGPTVSVAPVMDVYEAMVKSQQITQQQLLQHHLQATQLLNQQDPSSSQQQFLLQSTLPVTSDQQPQPSAQQPELVDQQYQMQEQKYVYDTPSYTPSPPGGGRIVGSSVQQQRQQQQQPPPPPLPPTSNPSSTTPKQVSSPEAPMKQPKKEPAEEFKTEFRFVVNEDAKTARNTVRQHVMREFRRRERWEQGKNKVTKAKKAKKDTKDPKETKANTLPPAADVAAPPSSQETRVPMQRDQSPRSTTFEGSVNSSFGDPITRRDSQAMSISGSSESSSIGGANAVKADADRFTALLQERTLNHRHRVSRPHPGVQPFSRYADNGIGLKPADVEEAVEEIERSELSFLPDQYNPWAEIARAEINPFSSQVSMGAGPASRALLHHYAWVMPSLMDEIVTGNVFHRIGWLYSAVAVHDPTPYYTIMGFTLGHVAMLRGVPEPRMATEHKEKSLKLIHSRLANPLVAASDGSIGAIANIAAYELIDCRPERFSIHMQGLSRLVTQRGGMSDFAHNPQLELVLIRLDAIRAYVTISSPRFPAWSAVRNLTPLAINIGPPSTDWFCPPTGYHQQQYLFAEDAIRLIHSVEDILSLIRSIHPTIPFTPDPSFKTLLQDSIVQHLRRDMLDTPEMFRNHVSRRVLRMAALVMIDIAVGEFFNPPVETAALDGNPANSFKATSPPRSHPAPATGSPSQTLHKTRVLSKPQESNPERTAGSPQAPIDRKGLGQASLRARFPLIEQYRHQWGRSLEMIVAVLMQAERMALERPFRAWYVADIVTLTMKFGDAEWEAVEQIIRADLVRRILDERAQKDEWSRRGINADQPWDIQETLTRFWAEWNESEF